MNDDGSLVRFEQFSDKLLSGIMQKRKAASIMTPEQSNEQPLRPIDQTTNNRSVVKFKQSRQQILPGILDEIAEFFIIPKLDWKTRRTLSTVSRALDRAMETSAEARILSLATDTKVIFEFCYEYAPDCHVRLMSMADGFTYRFPPITNAGPGREFRRHCTFLFLNGKVYALGGYKQLGGEAAIEVADVYVLDVVGQRQWQQCKSMHRARAGRIFRWAWVIRGKICVYDGREYNGLVELYDPNSNTLDEIYRVSGQIFVDVLHEVEDANATYRKLLNLRKLKFTLLY